MKTAKTQIAKILTLTFFFIFGLLACTSQSPETETLAAKAQRIHNSVLTVDSHNDTPMWLNHQGFDLSGEHSDTTVRNRVDLKKMKEGGLDAAFFAVFIGQGARSEEGNRNAISKAHMIFDSIDAAVNRYPTLARLASTPDDAYKNKKDGVKSIYIGIENGYAIGTDLSLIQEYYKMGARYITLCHTRNNDICDSSTDEKGPENNGLSDFGKEVVKEMNRLGMMVDISHVSDKSFFDVLALSEAPVIASHSDARAICDNPRNLTDSMLVALSKNGGVIQMCLLSAYVKTPLPNPQRDSAMADLHNRYKDYDKLSETERDKAHQEWESIDERFPNDMASVSDLVDHIDHIVSVAGIDHVGIGSDFDGGGGLSDCRDVSQMENITYELVKRGYTEEDIRKIWGGNLMRVFREVIKISESLNPA